MATTATRHPLRRLCISLVPSLPPPLSLSLSIKSPIERCQAAEATISLWQHRLLSSSPPLYLSLLPSPSSSVPFYLAKPCQFAARTARNALNHPDRDGSTFNASATSLHLWSFCLAFSNAIFSSICSYIMCHFKFFITNMPQSFTENPILNCGAFPLL